MILAKYKKQPGETLDYDISYAEFFSNRTDALASVALVVPTGITGTLTTSADTAKVVVSGGTNGVTYTLTVMMTTTTGIVKEDEFRVTVKEIS